MTEIAASSGAAAGSRTEGGPRGPMLPTLFAPGEAEAMVADIRQRLRRAGEAGREREEALRRFDLLMARLIPRLERHARAAFSRESLVEDAVAEMYRLLYRRICDTRPDSASARHWERLFNQCVKCTMIDAVRHVRRENDMDDLGRPISQAANGNGDGEAEAPEGQNAAAAAAPRPQVILFSDMPSGSRDAGDSRAAAPQEQFADPAAFAAMENVIGEATVREWLARVPDTRHAEAFRLHVFEGLTWPEIAERIGVKSEKTARTYADRATAILRDFISATHWKERQA